MSETALVKAKPRSLVVPENQACFEILEQTEQESETGYKLTLVPVPSSTESLTPLQQAVVLRSMPQWGAYSVPYLLSVILKCRSLGLDPMRGDVYCVDNRLSTTDEAKIRPLEKARENGYVEYVKISDPVKEKHPISGADDFYIEAIIKDKRETEPQNYKAWFSEWNNPKNTNWSKRPIESLQRKALARLCHRIYPLTEDGDDFQNVAVPQNMQLKKELNTKVFDVVAEVIND